VQVTVSGPERIVRSLKPSEVSAVLDLTGVKPGERTFDLGPRQVQVPRGLTVARVVPSQMHIDFNPSAARTVQVRPRVIGTFVSGYGIIDVTSDPATITIEGPENRVNAIDAAITDPVDATGVVGRATFTTHAYVADPLVRVRHPAPIHVTVTTGKPSTGAGQP
jgi:YbbR domain-containing protein